MATTYLITVSGTDRPGLAAALFGALRNVPNASVDITDIAQITIRGYLVLCVEVATNSMVSPESVAIAIADAGVTSEGINVDVSVVQPEEFANGKRLLLTVLAPEVTDASLEAIFQAMADCDATCERIVHLANYPVDCYEMVVRGPNHQILRERLTFAARGAGLDVAVQRAGLHRRSKHLVVLDADSTLLRDEVIDLIAEVGGCADEVRRITEEAMEGHLDFSESLRRRVALLEGLPVSVLDDVRARLKFTPGARTLIRTLQRLGYVPAVVSGGFVEVLAPLLENLGVEYLAANHLEQRDGVLTGRIEGDIVDRPGKAAALRHFASLVGVPLQQTVAIGDGANDIDMLALAGLGIAFNAKAVVRDHADAALNVPYLDAVLYFLGISREEIEAEA